MIFPPLAQTRAIAHILVVDDEPEIADSVAEFLSRSEGYRVTVTGDGREAMAVLESSLTDPAEAIDLVLLDVRMPVVSGPEVLAWLRDHPELKYTRVIVLTAAAGNEEKVEALSAGADDYITKPYYPLELLARVKTILRTQQLEKQLQWQSQQLMALNRISRSVTAKLTTSDVLGAAVEGVDDVLDVELALIFMANNARTQLRCRYVHPLGGSFTAEMVSPVPVGEGVIGNSFLEERSFRVDDPSSDIRFRPDLDAPVSSQRVRSMLVAPLVVRSRPVGIVVAINKREGSFTEIDLSMLGSLVSSVGRALEIAWLFQSLRSRQQELLESRNMLQAVIDGILHPIYTINDDWQLVAVNKTKSDELGRSPDELTGRTCFQVMFDRQKPCEHCSVAETLAAKMARHWSVSWLGQDHRPQEWDVTAYPVPGSKSGSARAVVVWQDRTEERRLEHSLMQAGKLAAIGQLAAGVAHEINNPLTAINANAQMLQMSIPVENHNYESVDLIVRAGDRAAKVVRGLLDFARQTQYEFESANLNDSVSQALNLVTYQFTAANIEVATQLTQGLPEVEASWEHLQSVWLNLLINARDALQEVSGERKIEVISQYDSVANDIMVIVRDNGRGMTEAELNHIFEPFYTTKAPGQGTGLGLATCLRIIEQHEGDIEVISKPGQGTTFIVRLPVKAE